MVNNDKIELLAESLIDDYSDLAMEVLGYSSKLSLGFGWHYLLDMIWILKELDLPKGSTILDAGAGTGLLQFVLASRGYRVISVDMTNRKVPHFAENIYNIDCVGESDLDHPYLSWHSFDGTSQGVRRAVTCEKHVLPRVTFYHADLRNMKLLQDDSIDGIVSLSALEHNESDYLQEILHEFERVLVPKGNILLTVSAAKKSYFHEPSHSWVLDEAGLTQQYGLQSDCVSNFSQFDSIIEGICNSKRLRDWLTHGYYKSEKNGMPWGKWQPTYQPVGVRKLYRK